MVTREQVAELAILHGSTLSAEDLAAIVAIVEAVLAEGSKTVKCLHEPVNGRCKHCDIRFDNGFPWRGA